MPPRTASGPETPLGRVLDHADRGLVVLLEGTLCLSVPRDQPSRRAQLRVADRDFLRGLVRLLHEVPDPPAEVAEPGERAQDFRVGQDQVRPDLLVGLRQVRLPAGRLRPVEAAVLTGPVAEGCGLRRTAPTELVRRFGRERLSLTPLDREPLLVRDDRPRDERDRTRHPIGTVRRDGDAHLFRRRHQILPPLRLHRMSNRLMPGDSVFHDPIPKVCGERPVTDRQLLQPDAVRQRIEQPHAAADQVGREVDEDLVAQARPRAPASRVTRRRA